MDPDARQIKMNYTGGSLTITVGNAKDLFGENYQLLASTAVPVESAVTQPVSYTHLTLPTTPYV